MREDRRTLEGGSTDPAFDARSVLSWVRDAIVYYVRERGRERIERRIQSRFRAVTSIEFVRRTLCRDDLLVEIEGIAHRGKGDIPL